MLNRHLPAGNIFDKESQKLSIKDDLLCRKSFMGLLNKSFNWSNISSAKIYFKVNNESTFKGVKYDQTLQ